ncbi:MAG TPA: TlpA disulfide reductase family protein [Candidatus Cloacimonadota bacterium]|nr:TlpA disulfide reductase family protein [Candidatus Cloacimonadota bacterium]HPS39742.1 TlpA disulfide reductase family protein [Candidatus Cloacimonadota bacterium]
MFPKYMIALSVVLLLVSTLCATAMADEFNSKLETAKSADDAMTIVQEYLPKMTDVNDLRTLQNVWMRIDKQACTAHFLAMHSQQPDSPVYHYLWVRTSEDDEMQIAEARKMITAHPEFYWGYRVLYAAYLGTLFDAKASTEVKERVAAYLPTDRILMHDGLKRFPGDEYALIALFNLYSYEKNYPLAEQYILGVSDPSALNANMDSIMSFVETSGRMTAFERLVPLMISAGISSGEINAADSTDVYDSYYNYMLGKTKNWDAVKQFFASHPQYMGNPKYNGTLLDMYIATQRYDEALNFISNALEKGEIDYGDLNDTEGWEALHELPRWKRMLAKAKADWEATEPARREAALANRKDTPAPLWEFPDKDGNIVKLADLKGQIVILDFWATWCSPCRATMPVLDEWMRTSMPKGVRVFSINIWEQDPQNAKKYIAEKKYRMTYLAGDADVSKNYGITGIPYICVIDKDGKIAWDKSGSGDDLAGTLSYWVDELIKPANKGE